MKLYKTEVGVFVKEDEFYCQLDQDWDMLLNVSNLYDYLKTVIQKATRKIDNIDKASILPPIGTQEIWASGVTYYKSREARMEEAKEAGGGDFYDRVYYAKRPELFFKSTAQRAVGTRQAVRIRKDATWNVPEPELTLVINKQGEIIGYTIGNDMSSRDIEGENPLYLPQAKTYDQSAAIGPCIWIIPEPIPKSTVIQIEILRNGQIVFEGATTVSQIKRDLKELVHYLFLELTFPTGAYLMTGTGIVPPNEFTLIRRDLIKITIEPIGTLENVVA